MNQLLQLKFQALSERGSLWLIAMGFWVTAGMSLPAHARFDLIPGALYQSSQSAAMGDAALQFAADVPSGLFINPANLGKLKKSSLSLMNLSAYANAPVLDHLGLETTGILGIKSSSSLLQKSVGKDVSVGGAFAPSLRVLGISLGLLAQSQQSARMNLDSTVTYRSLYQFVPSAGVGYSAFEGRVRFGYSLQWIHQAEGSGTGLPDGSLEYSNVQKVGSAISHHLGLSVTLPTVGLPQFDFVVRNLGGTHFTPSSFRFGTALGGGAPSSLPMSYDLAMGASQRMGMGYLLRLSLLYRDVTHTVALGTSRHLAVGAEISKSEGWLFRGGYRGGYGSFGLGFRRNTNEFSLAYFTEEVGVIGALRGDSRWLFQYQIGF